MNRSLSKLAIFATILGVLLAGADIGYAQAEEELELIEARVALRAAAVRIADLEKRVLESESANAALSESLAAANTESKQYRESYSDLRLQMEALGVEAIKPGMEGIEQRLLKAVNDVRILEEEKQALAGQLMRLAEATMNYMSTSVSARTEDRAIVEEELRVANEKLGLGRDVEPAPARSIDEVRVAGLKPEYGLIVLDAGEKSGLRIGMPLELLREKKIFATALVIDVRSGLAGAVLQGIAEEGEKVRIGDRVRVQTQTGENL